LRPSVIASFASCRIVSSNAWDVAGAGAYGFMTCWCNRTNMPADELDVTPDYEVDRLDAILERIGV